LKEYPTSESLYTYLLVCDIAEIILYPADILE